MYSFCAKFRQILDIIKRHSENLVNSLGNVPWAGVVPRFSSLEDIALSLTAEALEIDSENYLFPMLSQYGDEMPGLVSRRQYNDRAPPYGYCASQGKLYYGYKLHGLAGTSGVFHSCDITAANVHDIN